MFPYRLVLLASAIVASAGGGGAATPKEIDAAVQKATALLKEQFPARKGGVAAVRGQGTGATALVGLALLESGVPADDPVVKAITVAIRDAAFTETQTYHISLCLIYLDRIGEAADEPTIQMLGVRLLAGQNGRGGWTYTCIDPVSPADERALRTGLIVTELKAGGGDPPPMAKRPRSRVPGRSDASGKLHPVVEKYVGRLAASIKRFPIDDNSNTQFGVLGVWVARKHGVPAEHSLDLIEKRFLATQTLSGGWPYALALEGSPSMTCAGLLGLATAIGRREERRLKNVPIHKEDPFAKHIPKAPAKPTPKSDDPFFNPPPPSKADDPFFSPGKPAEPAVPPKNKKQPEPKKKGKVPTDVRDAAVHLALASLGRVLAGDAPQARGGRARFALLNGELGNRDFYFLWSLERVGVIFGLDKIGGVDWYATGAEELCCAQNADGSWGGGGRGSEVDTSFALLFLARSNLVRDLSSKVQKDASNTELRAGAGPTDTKPAPQPMALQPAPVRPAPIAVKTPAPVAPTPAAATSDPKAVATDLLGAVDADWAKTLARVVEAKGAANTGGLVLALHRLEGARLKSAREALAERLTRMTAATLRTMAKEKDAELRRGAVLAMAMKDDKAHLPDLIAALLDDEDMVVRAAKAGLKSLTGQDFGPAAEASLADRTAAAQKWLDWLRMWK